MEIWPEKELWKSLEGMLLLLCKMLESSWMLGLQPRRTLFFDPDYESREATLLVSCRQNDAPGILPASLVLTSLVQLPAPVSNYLRPFTGHQSPSWEKAMAPHSGTLAWKIPWVEEPGRLQSMGSLRVGHNWATSLSLFTFMHWRRKWQPAPLFLPGESQGRGSLVGCCLWGRAESDTTEVT